MGEWLFDLFLAPLGERWFLKALVAGCLVAVTCGVVGCLVILRRMAFLGDAIAHAMIAGVAAGYLLLQAISGIGAHAPAMLSGALIAALVTVALVNLVARGTRLHHDSAIGIMYTGIFAAGVVLVSMFRDRIHIDLVHFMTGDVLGVADRDLWMIAGISAVVLGYIIVCFRSLRAAAFDPTMAAAVGLPIVLLDHLLTMAVSLVVVGAVTIVGVILVIGLLITPAASAWLLTDRLSRMMWLSAGFGCSSVILGLYACHWFDAAGGGMIVLVATVQFAAILILAPRHGLLQRWWRRRSSLPQHLVEDILQAVHRRSDSVPTADLASYAADAGHRIERSLLARTAERLREDGLLSGGPAGWSLTARGSEEAQRLRRAHRLWETFLAQRQGISPERLHNHAHRLEHIHDEGALEYLDDALGHPLHDPHGSEIPPASKPQPGDTVPVSQLRLGHCGEIAIIAPAARSLDLVPGEQVRIGVRGGHEGSLWSLMRADGQVLTLDHERADAVLIRLDRPDELRAAP